MLHQSTNLLIALLIFLGVLFWLFAFLFTPLLPVSLASSLFVDDVGLSDWFVDVSEETDAVGWSELITGSSLCCSDSLAITYQWFQLIRKTSFTNSTSAWIVLKNQIVRDFIIVRGVLVKPSAKSLKVPEDSKNTHSLHL